MLQDFATVRPLTSQVSNSTNEPVEQQNLADFLYYAIVELKEVIFQLEQEFQKRKFYDELVYLLLEKLIRNKKPRKAIETFTEFYGQLVGLREKLIFAAKNLDLSKIGVLSSAELKLAKFYNLQLVKNQSELLRLLKTVHNDLQSDVGEASHILAIEAVNFFTISGNYASAEDLYEKLSEQDVAGNLSVELELLKLHLESAKLGYG